MSNSQRKATRKQSRHKAAIAPIRVEELLGAAGMSGFLGVLEPPASPAHLRRLLNPPAPAAVVEKEVSVLSVSVLNEGPDDASVPPWFQVRLEAMVGRLRTQQESLSEVSEVLYRMHAAAGKLDRRADSIRSSKQRAVRAIYREDTMAKKKNEAPRAKTGRCTTPAKWEDWTAAPQPAESIGDTDVLHEAIAKLARSYWEARGCQDGGAEQDWLRAEAEIRGALATRALENQAQQTQVPGSAMAAHA